MKKILLNWLLKDQEIRNSALKKVIGDSEVKVVYATGVENLELHDCIVYQSEISKIKNADIFRNTFDGCTIKEVVWKKSDTDV